MGQRHQLFVIARVGGRYRSLAAIHHQWLYGVSAVTTALRIIKIFSSASNRIPVQKELDLAVSFFNIEDLQATRVANPYDPDRKATTPFPFIVTCLSLGTCFEPDSARTTMIHELPYTTAYDEGDNNDGITIIDITSLHRISYCFVNYQGMESEKEVPLHTALTARQYTGAYRENPNHHDIKALEGIPLIKTGTLNDTWPDPFWQISEEKNTGPSIAKDVSVGELTLRDRSMAKVLDEILASDQVDLTWLDVPEQLHDFQQALKLRVLQDPSNVEKAPSCVEILRRMFAGQSHVDLSWFKTISPAVINSVLKSLKDIRSLDLSGTLVSVSVNSFRETMTGVDRIHDLYLLADPSQKQAQPLEILQALSTMQTVTNKVVLGAAMAASIQERRWVPLIDAPHMDCHPVQQMLWLRKCLPQYSQTMPEKGSRPEPYPLVDALLTPVRFITGLFNIFKCRIIQPETGHFMGGNGLDVAYSLATAPPSLNDPTGIEVGILPAETTSVARAGASSNVHEGCYAKMRPIDTRQWTVVVVQDTTGNYLRKEHKTQFAYAIVRARKDIIPAQVAASASLTAEDLEIVDFAGFLERTGHSKVIPDLKAHQTAFEEWVKGSGYAKVVQKPFLRTLENDEIVVAIKEHLEDIDEAEKRWQQALQWYPDGIYGSPIISEDVPPTASTVSDKERGAETQRAHAAPGARDPDTHPDLD